MISNTQMRIYRCRAHQKNESCTRNGQPGPCPKCPTVLCWWNPGLAMLDGNRLTRVLFLRGKPRRGIGPEVCESELIVPSRHSTQ